jgi:hypothetical protein
MQFSRDWLAQYVEPGPIEELRALLTRSGSSVEHVTIEGSDALLDVDITGNRPDCMNHLGLAREIAVLRSVPLRPPEAAPRETTEKRRRRPRVVVAEARLCPRYSARVLEDVALGPSPDWLVRVSRRSACARSTTWSTSPTSCCGSWDSRSTRSTSTGSKRRPSWCVARRRGRSSALWTASTASCSRTTW